jgi:hypothetical protein
MKRSRILTSLCALLIQPAVSIGQSSTLLSTPAYVTVAFNAAVL